MVRYDKPLNDYSTIINPEKNDIYEVYLRRKEEINQKIKEKKHLINLTEAMSGTPISEGGLSRERANNTVRLLNKDILNLEEELNKLKSNPDNPKIVPNRNNIYRDAHTTEPRKTSSQNVVISIILIILILSLIFFIITHIGNAPPQNVNPLLNLDGKVVVQPQPQPPVITNISSTPVQSKFKSARGLFVIPSI